MSVPEQVRVVVSGVPTMVDIDGYNDTHEGAVFLAGAFRAGVGDTVGVFVSVGVAVFMGERVIVDVGVFVGETVCVGVLVGVFVFCAFGDSGSLMIDARKMLDFATTSAYDIFPCSASGYM